MARSSCLCIGLALILAGIVLSLLAQPAAAAATDNRFQFYSKAYPNKDIMVCKHCQVDGPPLQGVVVDGEDGGFHIWVFDSGIIQNTGDGGLDNWQFSGCFTRSGVQGHIVTFTPTGTC